jgi:hypothetical protein
VGERFRIGRVVARSFAIWGRELRLLLVLALVMHAPRVASVECLELAVPEFPQLVTQGGDPFPHDVVMDRVEEWLRRALPIRIVSSLLQALFTHLSLAFVVFAVYARLQGRHATFGDSVRGGLRRFLPVFRVALCLILFAATLSWGAWLLRLQFLRHGLLGEAILLSRLPIHLLVTLMLSPFWVAVPAAVTVEPRGLLRSSWRLTRGHRLAVCGILVLLYTIDWGSGRLLRLGLGSAHLPLLAWRGIWWTQDLLVVSLTAVFAAVGYHALRLEKEGVDVSDLERVFA